MLDNRQLRAAIIGAGSAGIAAGRELLRVGVGFDDSTIFDALDSPAGPPAQRFSRFSWASPDCQGYYRNAAGNAPFLFPGNFKEYSQLQDDSGLHEYDLT